MIYPAVDIYENKVVRLEKGSFDHLKTYCGKPIKIIEKFYKLGFPWVHLVDLSGSKKGKFQLGNLLKEIKKNIPISVQVGGGLRSYQTVKDAFLFGADRVLLGSILFSSKNEVKKIIKEFGRENISFCLDGKEVGGLFKLYKNAWRDQAEDLEAFLESWKSFLPPLIFVTDIEKDGTLKGPNINIYEKLLVKYPHSSWAVSGGIDKIETVKNLKIRGIKDMIIGKAIYEKKIDLEELGKELC